MKRGKQEQYIRDERSFLNYLLLNALRDARFYTQQSALKAEDIDRIGQGRSTPNSFAAMLSDEADFSQAAPMYVPISREKGGKTKVVAQVVNPSAGASGEWDSHAAIAMMATVVIVSCQLARPWMKGILFVRMT